MGSSAVGEPLLSLSRWMRSVYATTTPRCPSNDGGGHDTAVLGLYVQEYGADCPPPNTNRVYISYLDTVRYVTPPSARSTLFHAVLIGYLQVDTLTTHGTLGLLRPTGPADPPHDTRGAPCRAASHGTQLHEAAVPQT